MKLKFLVIAVGLFAALVAVAQVTTVNQGQPGKQGAWPVVISGGSSTIAVVVGVDGGAVPTAEAAHKACTNTTMNVGTTGTACPATASASRSSILIQLVQAGEVLTITSDGSTAATATVGAQVTSGATYTDNLSPNVAANCRCTAATCSVRIVECP